MERGSLRALSSRACFAVSAAGRMVCRAVAFDAHFRGAVTELTLGWCVRPGCCRFSNS